jgi:hypothetical protein
MGTFLYEAGHQAMWASPFIALEFVGLLICLRFRQRNGLQAIFGVLAFSVFLISRVISIAIRAWLASALANPSSVQKVTLAGQASNGFLAVMLASLLAWVFLLVSLYHSFNPVKAKVQSAV